MASAGRMSLAILTYWMKTMQPWRHKEDCQVVLLLVSNLAGYYTMRQHATTTSLGDSRRCCCEHGSRIMLKGFKF
eukprot:scaffold314133_cov15-Prasinocladus_malaysianus.AAC.2